MKPHHKQWFTQNLPEKLFYTTYHYNIEPYLVTCNFSQVAEYIFWGINQSLSVCLQYHNNNNAIDNNYFTDILWWWWYFIRFKPSNDDNGDQKNKNVMQIDNRSNLFLHIISFSLYIPPTVYSRFKLWVPPPFGSCFRYMLCT